MQEQTTISAIEELKPWFHNLHLSNGAQTAPEHPLGDFPASEWRQLVSHLLANLTGWSADIGCNAGFYSFELVRRGAMVTAINVDGHYLQQARWAAREFGLEERITFKQMQVYELARVNETYDLVWFMGGFLSSSLSFSRAQHCRAQGEAIDGVSDSDHTGRTHERDKF